MTQQKQRKRRDPWWVYASYVATAGIFITAFVVHGFQENWF